MSEHCSNRLDRAAPCVLKHTPVALLLEPPASLPVSFSLGQACAHAQISCCARSYASRYSLVDTQTTIEARQLGHRGMLTRSGARGAPRVRGAARSHVCQAPWPGSSQDASAKYRYAAQQRLMPRGLLLRTKWASVSITAAAAQRPQLCCCSCIMHTAWPGGWLPQCQRYPLQMHGC